MMLLLIKDVLSDTFYLRWTNCETKVTRLPFELLLTNHLVNPCRRIGLDIAKNVVQPMGGAQPDEQMNMIFNATNHQRNAVDPFNNTTEIGMKVWAPVLCDQRHSILGTENEMVVKTEMS